MRKLVLTLTAWLLATSMAVAQVVTGSVPNTFVNGTIIDATQVNADYTYIINQVNANAAKNGVNNDITALLALSAALTPVQGGSSIYYAGAATGTANVIVVATAVPANFTLATGKTIRFIGGAASNTGATTLAVNGTVATAIVRQTPLGILPLTGGEIQPGQLAECYYDGTQYELLNNPQQQGGYGFLTGLAASATPDLGTVPSHNVNLTGGPFAITSFGSSASTAYPMYLVRFNAANTLTQGANLALLNSSNRLTAPSDEGIYFYNGAGAWFELAYFPAGPKYASTAAGALTIKNNGGIPATEIDISASEVVMDTTGGGNYYTENYGTCTINFSVNGAGGLDAGAIAANTWYFLYTISNGSANSCLASTSATTPTMPAGYVYKVRVGANKTNSGAATLWPVYQAGKVARFTTGLANTADRTVSSGAVGTCTAGAITTATAGVWGTLAPSTASATMIGLSENNSTVGVFQAPLAVAGQSAVPGTFLNSTAAATGEYTYTYNGSVNVNVCGGASTTEYVNGWIDNVNAN